MRYCPNCHAAIQSDTQKFCSECGAPLPAAAPEQPAPAEGGPPPLARNPDSPLAPPTPPPPLAPSPPTDHINNMYR